MVTDLLSTDGHVSGALGVQTRTSDIYSLRAKAIVLTTGRSTRLSRNVTGIDFDLRVPGSLTGDGKAMALREGADIINMEFFTPARLGIANYQTAGGPPRNTWQPGFRLVDEVGNVVIPRTKFYDWANLGTKKLDVAETRKKWLEDRLLVQAPLVKKWREGKGPFYLDGTGATEEEVQYAEWSLAHEGKCYQFSQHLKEEGVDLRKDKIEYGMNDRELAGASAAGLVVNKNLETTLKGLFAAGDEVGGLPWSASPGAISMGWHAGDMAARHAKERGDLSPVSDERLNSLKELCAGMLQSEEGFYWKEVELAVQNIMGYYCHDTRSAGLLKRGLERLEDRTAAGDERGPHEG
jgi:succinate dehydrogenase/fumarate reductase flavoprotein subunit